jgi:hypothetical protein
MIGILLALNMTAIQADEYVISCRFIASEVEQWSGTYCTFPNGDIAKQNCEEGNEGTENCVLGHVIPTDPGRN